LSKSEIRKELLARRRAYVKGLAHDARLALEAELAARILPRLAGASVIAFYHPMRDEISPLPLLEALHDGQQAVFPWFADRDATMLFRDGPASEVGPWGVLQPSASAEARSPDTILVPLVVVDRAGTRIGQGKGHYDRALANLVAARPLRTIGIGWDLQLVDEPLPHDPWDVPLDHVATPGAWVDAGRAREGQRA
jgi:5-formyltetrahydrofolate cyclo-ligase